MFPRVQGTDFDAAIFRELSALGDPRDRLFIFFENTADVHSASDANRARISGLFCYAQEERDGRTERRVRDKGRATRVDSEIPGRPGLYASRVGNLHSAKNPSTS